MRSWEGQKATCETQNKSLPRKDLQIDVFVNSNDRKIWGNITLFTGRTVQRGTGTFAYDWAGGGQPNVNVDSNWFHEKGSAEYGWVVYTVRLKVTQIIMEWLRQLAWHLKVEGEGYE